MTNTKQFTVRLTDDLDALRGQTEEHEVTVLPQNLRKGDVIDSHGRAVVETKVGTKWVTATVTTEATDGPALTATVKYDIDTEITVTRQVPTAIAEEAWNVHLAVRQVEAAVTAHEKAVAKIASGSSSDLAWYADEVMATEALANIWTEWANHVRHNDVNRDAALTVLADFVDHYTDRVLTWRLSLTSSAGHRMEDAAKLSATQSFVEAAAWLVR